MNFSAPCNTPLCHGAPSSIFAARVHTALSTPNVRRLSTVELSVAPNAWKSSLRQSWHIMTRRTGPDCAVVCNIINAHTHTHVVPGNRCSNLLWTQVSIASMWENPTTCYNQILRHARGQRNIIFPVQLTTSRIGNLTRLIHTLLYVMSIHTYIHLNVYKEKLNASKPSELPPSPQC